MPSSSERLLSAGALLSSALPWVGGVVSQFLSGQASASKFRRVKEVLDGLASDLQDVQNEAAEAYIRREEFQDLFERSLRQVSMETSYAKRLALRRLLAERGALLPTLGALLGSPGLLYAASTGRGPEYVFLPPVALFPCVAVQHIVVNLALLLLIRDNDDHATGASLARETS